MSDTSESVEKTSVGRRWLVRTIKFSVFVAFAGLIASWIVAGRLVAARPTVIGNPPEDLPAENIELSSESGAVISGWNIPASDSKGVLILLHGIRGSRMSMLERARMFYQAGYSIVMIDLRAHGESTGAQITLGHLERFDVRAAVDFARSQYAGQAVGVVGVSLGGASTLLAAPIDIDALVLESVFPDIVAAVENRVAARLGVLSAIPAKLLLLQLEPRLGVSASELSPIDCIAKLNCPVYVISGSDDLHTTAEETKRIFQVASQPKQLWLIEGAAHEDLCEFAGEAYRAEVIVFLDRYMKTESAP